MKDLGNVTLKKYCELSRSLKRIDSKTLAQELNICRQYASEILAELEKLGYIQLVDVNQNLKIYNTTGKKWQNKEIRSNQVPHSVLIEIRPDIAASWVKPFLPHLEKKSIPIVRSIGLGARQNTL